MAQTGETQAAVRDLQRALENPFEGMELPIGYRPAVPSVFVGLGLRAGR